MCVGVGERESVCLYFVHPVVFSFGQYLLVAFKNLIAFKAVNLFSECMFSSTLKLISSSSNCHVNTKL